MMLYPDADFQERLDQFNDAQGGPARIAVTWEPTIERWRVWAIPVNDSSHPLARNSITAKMLRPLGNGHYGIKLNIWCGENGRYLPLDERFFDALRWADSFRDKEHFEKTIEHPETAKELARNKLLRELAYNARSYWWHLDRLAINPQIKASGDWRWRTR